MQSGMQNQPRTPSIVWVGATDHPEVTPLAEACRLTFAVHWRRSLAEYVRHPVADATQVVWVRLDREEPSELVSLLSSAAPAVPNWLVLEGPLCAGNQRTRRLLSKSASGAMNWREQVTIASTSMTTVGFLDLLVREHREQPENKVDQIEIAQRPVAIFGATRSSVSWLRDVLAEQGWLASALPATAYRSVADATVCLWDDAGVCRIGETRWLDHLQSQQGQLTRHLRLASLPVWQDRDRWLAAGVSAVVRMPLRLSELLATLRPMISYN